MQTKPLKIKMHTAMSRGILKAWEVGNVRTEVLDTEATWPSATSMGHRLHGVGFLLLLLRRTQSPRWKPERVVSTPPHAPWILPVTLKLLLSPPVRPGVWRGRQLDDCPLPIVDKARKCPCYFPPKKISPMDNFSLARNMSITWALNKVQISMCNYMLITLNDVITMPALLCER